MDLYNTLVNLYRSAVGIRHYMMMLMGNDAKEAPQESDQCYDPSAILPDLNGNNALFLAVMNGASREELRQLIENGEDWKSFNADGNTVVHLAAESGNLEALDLFLSKRANVHARNKYGSTPLIKVESTPRNFIPILELLIKNGADINAVNQFGWNTLFFACRECKPVEHIKKLLEMGSKWDNPTKDNKSILRVSAESGNLEALRLFISLGADVNARDSYGNTPLIAATNSKRNFIPMAKLLLENGADINAVWKGGYNMLYIALDNGKSVEELDYLVMRGASVSPTNDENVSILHLAALRGNYKHVQYFVSKGVDVNGRRKNGDTPLMCAVKANEDFIPIVDLLVDNGANINSFSKTYCNVLFYAVGLGKSVQEMEELVNRGCSTKNQDGYTILHILAEHGHLEGLRHFIDRGEDVNARTKDGITPLMYAARKNKKNLKEVVECLVLNDGDINAVDEVGYSALFHAVIVGRSVDELSYLVDLGARVDLRSKKRHSVLHLAAEYGNLGALRYFIVNGAYVNERNASGETPLMTAARCTKQNFTEVVNLLVDNGGDVFARDLKGKTVLSIAFDAGRPQRETFHLEMLQLY